MKKPKPTRFGLVFLFTVFTFLTLLVTIALFSSVMMTMLQAGWFDDTSLAAKMIPVIVSAVGALAVGTVISNLIVRIPLQPIKRLIAAMRRLSEGHFEERLELEEDPLGELSLFREVAETFNTLASELQSTEMLRSDFVNNFSHEFKTPIVSISGFAQILRHGGLPEEEQREYLDIIVDESARLTHMATSVLNMTKIENQTILTEITVYNVSEQIRKCILMLEKKWVRKNLSIAAEFSEYQVSGNMQLLNQVWINLLDNAVKFSPDGAEVEVSIREEADKIIVSFSNYGPEITRDQERRIYDKFWQGDSSHASEGTGIGLSIVKKIVELHKGKIEVTSSAERTVFSVYLPGGDREG